MNVNMNEHEPHDQIPKQLANRFNQARDAYINAAMRRIDLENSDELNFDDKQEVEIFIRLNEIEDRELENFQSIYADIRNHNVNVRPFPKRLLIGTKSQVWKGLAKKTSKGLTKKDLMKNKNGNVVMRK